MIANAMNVMKGIEIAMMKMIAEPVMLVLGEGNLPRLLSVMEVPRL